MIVLSTHNDSASFYAIEEVDPHKILMGMLGL